jgi:hypothetical protein
MTELIAFIVLVFSLIGLATILFRKIPLLLEFPETSSSLGWKTMLSKAKDLSSLNKGSFETLLQKILSKIRVVTLKTDNKTSGWLQRLRERSVKKRFEEEDNYWEKIRKSTRDTK